MAAKKQKSRPAPQRKSNFNFEENKFFVPIVFALIFVVLIIMFGDFIFSDKMLSGSDTIQAGIYFRSMLVDSVHETGTVPLWNPHIFGGMPYVEAFHGDIFYPLSFIKFFGPIHRTLGFVLIFHIFLAGIFMYFCARQFKLLKIPSLFAAVSYMFAAYLVSLVAPGHDGKIFVTTLFPLVILFLDRGFNAETIIKSFFNYSVLGLIIGFIILSPHIQMMYFSMWALSFYALLKLISNYLESKSIPQFLTKGALTAYAVIIGVALSAIQFLPGYIYTNEFSPRGDTKQGWEWATSWSMHEEEAMSLLIPEFSGVSATNPEYQRATYYWGKNAFKDNSESVSVVALFIALLAVFLVRKKEAYFFGGLALFAFVYALGGTTPIFKIFFYLIPKVKSLRAPSMIMFLFSFSVSLLAAMGIQKLIEEGRSLKEKAAKRFNYILIGFPALLLLLALLFSMGGEGMLSAWTSLFYSDATSIQVQQGFTKFDVAKLNLPAIKSGAWLSFFFTALAALFLWLYRTGKSGVVILSALILLPMINGFRFNKRFITTHDPREWQANALTDYFNNIPGQFRVMNFVSNAIREDYLPHFGIDVVVGYHGNQLKWYDNLLGGPQKSNMTNPNFLNLVGAKYFLLPANQQFPIPLGDIPLRQAANMGQLAIVQNDNALPRVFLVDQYKVFDNYEQVNDTILYGPNTFRELVYLEKEPILSYTHDSASTDSVWITDYQLEEITVNANVSSNKILVMTDNYYDGWKVSIDGQDAELLRAFGSFRGVEIPAGTKEIKFYFDSERYNTGKTITYLTTIFLIIVIGGYFGMGMIRRKKEENFVVSDEQEE